MMQYDNGVTVEERCLRASDAMFYLDEAIWKAVCDEHEKSGSIFFMFGNPLSKATEQRIRRRAIAEFAADNDVSVDEVKNDLRLVEAIETIENENDDVSTAIMDGTLDMQPSEVIRLGRLSQPRLKKALIPLERMAEIRACLELF